MPTVNLPSLFHDSPGSIHLRKKRAPEIMKQVVLCLTLLCALPLAAQNTPEACSNITLGANGALNGFVPSSSDAWHQDISQSPVDPKSDTIINTIGDLGSSHLHADFSSVAGGGYGIPYTVVDSSQTPNVPVVVNLYGSSSDLSSIPLPQTAATEGGTAAGCTTPSGDRHAIVIDRKGCVVYELYQATTCNTGWQASAEAMWDMLGTEKRPWRYTSVDAGGLSIFSGLLRYDEIVAGEVNHAIRFTAQKTRSDSDIGYFTLPATHAAGNNSKSDNIMGMRIRLRADYDISGFSQTNQIILRAMKKYGMILADNGSNLYFQGTTDARWNDSDLRKLSTVPSTAFEVMQMGTVYQSSTVPTGAAPVINSFKASANNIASGAAVTLTPSVTGASYSYIDSLGLVRGAVTVNPTATTTYKLTSRNAYGTTSASVTVTVGAATTNPTLAFPAMATRTYGDVFSVKATSNSPGAITYTVVSGPATVSGSTITTTGVGTVILNATQAASGTYNSATATTVFTVVAANPGLAFATVAAKTYPSSSFTVSSTTKSGGSISYAVTSGPATISGNTVTLTGTGTVVLTANQAAAGNYTAGSATTSFAVTAGAGTTPTAPTLTLPAVRGVVYGAGPFSAATTSNSPGAITYSIASGPATISGALVTPTGVGTIIVRISQAASGNYTAATASLAVYVNGTPPNLVVTPLPIVVLGTGPILLTSTSLSSAPVTYTLYSGSGTLLNGIFTPSAAGLVSFVAKQPAAGNYAAGTAYLTVRVTAATTQTAAK